MFNTLLQSSACFVCLSRSYHKHNSKCCSRFLLSCLSTWHVATDMDCSVVLNKLPNIALQALLPYGTSELCRPSRLFSASKKWIWAWIIPQMWQTSGRWLLQGRLVGHCLLPSRSPALCRLMKLCRLLWLSSKQSWFGSPRNGRGMLEICGAVCGMHCYLWPVHLQALQACLSIHETTQAVRAERRCMRWLSQHKAVLKPC